MSNKDQMRRQARQLREIARHQSEGDDDVELDQILTSVRRQFRAFFLRMATENMPWHLHRTPGTDQFSIFRDDATFDVPLPRVVENIHAMTEERLVLKVIQILRS